MFWSDVEDCCCVRLLAWHSVMETTMVEPVRRGAFTPWHQTWHRAHPGLSVARLGFPINPHSLASSFSFSLHFCHSRLLSISPTFCVYTHGSCLYLPQSLFSISSFLLPHKDRHSPVALKGEQKRPLKMRSLHRNAMAVGISALRFTPLALLARVTLCFSFTEGSLFSIASVWERVTWRSGGGTVGLMPSWKE